MSTNTARELRPVGLLLVGNFLSGSGRNQTVCEDLAERLRRGGWPVVTTSHRVGRLARLAGMLLTVCRERHSYAVAHVDVYSGAAFFWAEAVALALQSLRKPCVLTLHGGNLPAFAQRWPGRVRRLLQSAAAVTVPSRYLQRQMVAYCPQLHFLPNALDVHAYQHRTRSSPRPQLLWVRAFSQVYNPGMAPRVVADLTGDFPSLRLVMLGPDKGDGSLQQTRSAAEALGIANHIHFAGAVPHRDVARWMNEADIFLNTTHVDNAPVSVLEAMSAGMCVVSTDVGGVPDLIESQQNGVLVPPDDARAMAQAVRSIFSDPAAAARLSQSGREFAETRDWSQILPVWQALLTNVAQGRTEACRGVGGDAADPFRAPIATGNCEPSVNSDGRDACRGPFPGQPVPVRLAGPMDCRGEAET